MYELLKAEVMSYLELEDSARLKRQIAYKTLFLLFFFAMTYAITINAYHNSILLGLIFNSLYVFASLLIVFCIFHDSSHRSLGQDKWVNYIICSVVGGLFGASSSAWVFQHVRQHHGHTNIPGSDKDIEQGVIFRLHGATKKKKWHQWQHLYALPLYSLIILKWFLMDDFVCVLSNTYNLHAKRRMILVANVLLAKMIHVVFFLIVPYAIIGNVGGTLVFYFFSMAIMGLAVSVIFQLAHLTGVQQFPEKRIRDWSEHHLNTTANFSNSNSLFTWALGALNFQIEHHLFPGISHQLYPKISPLVKAYCLKNGLPYNEFPTFFGALKAHLIYLKGVGSTH